MKFYLKTLAIVCIAILSCCSSNDNENSITDDDSTIRLKKIIVLNPADEILIEQEIIYSTENRLSQTIAKSIASGNVETINYIYNTNGQIIGYGQNSFSYNANGKIDRMTRNNLTFQFMYNNLNQLSQVDILDSSSTLKSSQVFTYNTQGQLVESATTQPNSTDQYRFTLAYNSLGMETTVTNYRSINGNAEENHFTRNYAYSEIDSPFKVIIDNFNSNSDQFPSQPSLLYRDMGIADLNPDFFTLNFLSNKLKSLVTFQNLANNSSQSSMLTIEVENNLVTKINRLLLNSDGTSTELNYQFEYETYTP